MNKLCWNVFGVVALALVLTACGEDSSPETTRSGGPTVSIDSPADGDEVAVPFTLELSASVVIGPPESGNHHVHIFFDGNEDDYQVVATDTFEIEALEPGTHTITVSLRNPDHSDAGAQDEISVTVTSS